MSKDIDIEELKQNISLTQEDYDQWHMHISKAKDYSLSMGDITAEKYNDIDKMRELISSKDKTLAALLDEKAALLQNMQKKNQDFLDNLDLEYRKTNSEYEEKLQQLHTELSQIDTTQ